MLAQALASALMYISDYEQNVAVLRGALAATHASEAAVRAEGREQDADRLALEACQVRPGWYSRQVPVGCCGQNISGGCGVSWPSNAIPVRVAKPQGRTEGGVRQLMGCPMCGSA